MLDTLETLCCLDGVSGAEDEIREYILERCMPYADEITTDAMGNLLVFRKGRVTPPHRVMLCAHMDEVGLMIMSVTDEGYLRFAPIGGIDRRVLPGKRVFVGPDRVPGVIGSKAVHLLTAEERKKAPAAELYIDIGAASRDEASKYVRIGDSAAFDDALVHMGGGYIKARAIDDRVGCACMLELLESDLACDCWFAFTVQEEVGSRGARVAAWSLRPELALVLEATTAADIPGVSGADRVCALGAGPVIPFADGGTLYDRELCSRLISLAEEHNLPWQTKTRITGGTDASVIQRSRAGVRTAALSVPVRNLHSPACVAKLSDCEGQLQLAGLFLEAVGK